MRQHLPTTGPTLEYPAEIAEANQPIKLTTETEVASFEETPKSKTGLQKKPSVNDRQEETELCLNLAGKAKFIAVLRPFIAPFVFLKSLPGMKNGSH